MICILLATLRNTIKCRPQQGLGREAVLFVLAGMYRFSNGKSVCEGIDGTVTGWLLNLEPSISSGRVRIILTPI